MATTSNAGGGSSMGNAGQGTRGMSGSDWTRMQRLRGAKNNYNDTPVISTGNVLTTAGTNANAGNGVLAYTLSQVTGTAIPLTVTFTTAPATINVVSATGVNKLQPVIFSTSFAGLVGGTTYYVGSGYSSGTAIPLSSTSDGATALTGANAITASTSTSNGGNVSVYNISVTVGSDSTTLSYVGTAPTYPTLTDLAVIFHTSTNANITVGKVYFVKALVSTTGLTLAATYQGTALTSFTSGGTASGSVFPSATGSFSHTAQTSGAVTLAVTGFAANPTNTLTVTSGTYTIGTPITVSTASYAGLSNSTTYYIYATITSNTAIQLTLTPGGGGTPVQLSGTTSAGTLIYGSVLTVTNTNLTIGMPIVFTTTVQNIISGTTYYVQSLISTTGISISSAPDLLTTFVAGASSTGSAFRSVVGCNAFSVASGSGGALTLSNIYAPLSANNSILFTTTPTGLTAGNPYFLLTASGTPTAITYSQTYGGSAYAVGSGTGVGYAVATTTFTALSLTTASTMTLTGTPGSVGNPIVFGSTFGGLTSPTVYYISSVSSQVISVATSSTTSAVTFNVGSANTYSLTYSPVYSRNALTINTSAQQSLSLFVAFGTNPVQSATGGTGTYLTTITNKVALKFGIQGSAGTNLTSIIVDLQSATSQVYYQIKDATSVVSATGITVAAGDVLGFIIVGPNITFYKNNVAFATGTGITADTYSFVSNLNNLGALTVSQNLSVAYSQTTVNANSIIQSNSDISPQMAAQYPYNPSILIKPVVGTGKIRRPASNWTDYLASQTGDFITFSQNVNPITGITTAGVTQKLTKICDSSGTVYSPSKNIIPGVNQFNRLKILS